MSGRRYWYDPYDNSLPIPCNEGVYEEDPDDDEGDIEEFTISEARAVAIAISQIKKAFKFLAEETDIVWGIEPVDYKEKFDGGYHVNAILFHDQLSLSTEPIAMIREDDY